MELPECLLRRLIICDGQAVVTDPLRPHRTDGCYCRQLLELEQADELARDLRWLRARAVARSPRLQAAMSRRQSLSGFLSEF